MVGTGKKGGSGEAGDTDCLGLGKTSVEEASCKILR